MMNEKAVDIIFTNEAVQKALELRQDFKRYRDLPLRIYIEGKGCDGFTYGISFDPQIDGDIAFEQGQLNCIIDRESYMFCKGATVSWIDDERGTGFLVDNPNQKKFRGKFYKRKTWQEKLDKNSKAHNEQTKESNLF